MKRSLLNYIYYYTKLDERTIKHYLNLLDQRFLSNAFLKYYTIEHSLLNFEKWLMDKSLLIKVQNGYLILPPVSALLTGLIKLRDNLKSLNELYVKAFLESIRDFEKKVLMISDINAEEEASVISTYRKLIDETAKSLTRIFEDIEVSLEHYSEVSELLSSLIGNISSIKIKLDKEILEVGGKIENIYNFIKEKKEKISREIIALEENLREIENSITNFAKELKSISETVTNNIAKITKTQTDLLEETVRRLSNSTELIKNEAKGLESELIKVFQVINEKKNEVKKLLDETEENIRDIIRSEAKSALKTMSDTLNSISEETLKTFNKKIQVIQDKVSTKSNEFLSKIDAISRYLINKADELIVVISEITSILKKNLDNFLLEKISYLDEIESEILSKLNKLIKVNEVLIKEINQEFIKLNKIADKQADLLSRYISIYLTNLEVEKIHLIENLKVILESRNEKIKTLDEIFSRVRGAIGRLEDFYNLKIRQIYKSLNDLRKEGEKKLLDISTEKVLGSIKALTNNILDISTSMTQLINLIEQLGNKIDLRFTKFTENHPSIDMNRLNELIKGLNENDRKEVIKLFNQQRYLYISALKAIQKETKKDINTMLENINQRVKVLNNFDSTVRSDINNFADEVMKVILEAYNALIGEYINLLYESTKESIIQMIGDGERIIDEERLKIKKGLSSSMNLSEKITSDLINLLNTYHGRITETLDNLSNELRKFISREFTEFKESIIENVSKSIEQYKNGINELLEIFKGLTIPLRNYLGETREKLQLEISEETNKIKKIIEDHTRTIESFNEKGNEEIKTLNKEMISEISNILNQIKELKKIDIENHIRIFNKAMSNIDKKISVSTHNTINAVSNLIDTSLDNMHEEIKDRYSELLGKIVGEFDEKINEVELALKSELSEVNNMINKVNEMRASCLDSIEALHNKLDIIIKKLNDTAKEITRINNDLSVSNHDTLNRMRLILKDQQESLEKSIKLTENISAIRSRISTLIESTRYKREKISENINQLKTSEKQVIDILAQYLDVLTKPIDYLKRIVSSFKENCSRKLKKIETNISTEIINLIDLGNSLLNLISDKWRNRNIVGEFVYGKNTVIEYIKSAVRSRSNNTIMLVPSEIMSNLLNIIGINNISGRIIVYTSKKDIHTITNNHSIKIEKMKRDISYLVIINEERGAIICDRDLRYAIEFVNNSIINEIILTWIKSKYTKKIRLGHNRE